MKARFLVCTLLVLSLTCVSSAQLSGNYTIDRPVPDPTTTPRGRQPCPRSARA